VAAVNDQTLATLEATLAQTTDDRERAGLYDAIAIQLSRRGRLEEAVVQNARAVALRNAFESVLSDIDLVIQTVGRPDAGRPPLPPSTK